jgi:hypothetical protein
MEIKGNYVLVEGYGNLLIPAKHFQMLEHCLMAQRRYRDGEYQLEMGQEEMTFRVVPESKVRAAYAAGQLENPK